MTEVFDLGRIEWPMTFDSCKVGLKTQRPHFLSIVRGIEKIHGKTRYHLRHWIGKSLFAFDDCSVYIFSVACCVWRHKNYSWRILIDLSHVNSELGTEATWKFYRTGKRNYLVHTSEWKYRQLCLGGLYVPTPIPVDEVSMDVLSRLKCIVFYRIYVQKNNKKTVWLRTDI